MLEIKRFFRKFLIENTCENYQRKAWIKKYDNLCIVRDVRLLLPIRCRMLWKDEFEVQRKPLYPAAYCIDVLGKTTKFLDIMGLISCLSGDSKMEVPITRRKLYAGFSLLDNWDIAFEMLKYLLTSLLKWQQLIVKEIIWLILTHGITLLMQ